MYRMEINERGMPEMAKIRNGDKKALLVIDVQNGVVQNAYDRNSVVTNISKVIQKARLASIPVIFVQHINDEELPINSSQWQIVEELEIHELDYRITKRYNSSFENTDLDKILEKLEIAELIITGAATNWCVRATAFGALAKGYSITLVSDAHTTDDMEISKGKYIFAKDIIDELNIGIKYVEYPDIKTTVVSAEELLIAIRYNQSA